MQYWKNRHRLVYLLFSKKDTPEYETTIAGFHNSDGRYEVVLHHGPTIPFEQFLDDYVYNEYLDIRKFLENYL